jgi:hypothetical protein
MWKATRRRLGSPAWLAIGLVCLIPTLAEAQLFPNRTIKRERPPCNQEPPFNAQVRRDYFGYYPTCWTRFPTGWQCPCPNPELPNLDASLRERPLSLRKPELDDPGLGVDERDRPGDPGGRMRPGDNPELPPPTNPGRSPFDMDPTPRPPGAQPNTDPFDSPNPPNPTPPTPNPPGPGNRPSTSSSMMDMPKLPAVAPSASFESPLQPGSMALAPEATLASSDAPEARPDLGPLPPSPVSIPNNLSPPSDTMGQPLVAAPAPVQAPRRRGFLSTLFGSKDTRNR